MTRFAEIIDIPDSQPEVTQTRRDEASPTQPIGDEALPTGGPRPGPSRIALGKRRAEDPLEDDLEDDETRERVLREELDRIQQRRRNTRGHAPSTTPTVPIVLQAEFAGHTPTSFGNVNTIIKPYKMQTRPKDAPEYRGTTIRDCHAFILKCETIFEWTPTDFVLDEYKVKFGILCLKGEVESSWRRHNHNGKAQENLSWKLFTRWLADQISDPVNREAEFMQKYETAVQGKDQTVSSFANYLDELTHEVPAIRDSSEELRAKQLFTKLKPSIRHKMTEQGHVPATLPALISEATRVDQLFKGFGNPGSGFASGSTQGGRRYNDSTAGPSTNTEVVRYNVDPNVRGGRGRGSWRGRSQWRGGQSNWRGQPNWRGNNRGRPYQRGQSTWQPRGANATPVTTTSAFNSALVCFNCQGIGHKATDCGSPRKFEEVKGKE